MPKAKKQKINAQLTKRVDGRRSSKITKSPTTVQKKPQTTQHQQIRPPTIPFDVFDNILLIGEGDLSFTLSLLLDHGCASLTATTYDSLPALLEKNPHAAEHIKQITSEDQTILHDVDATKLSSNKDLRKKAPFNSIFFNFPHTGGLSTDVNRQVRANQLLLSEFFKSSLRLLAPSGSILVTLFESEPYTLWNIRDLARDAGLLVKRSWKFEREAYPLYKHARTAGVIKGKDGEKSESAWKGEDRAARTYEFGVKDENEAVAAPVKEEKGIRKSNGKGKKRRKEEDSDDSDD